MTDITELEQSHDLLIENGNETANLLRHLANNEIDSDYFAVVSECESYGQETDAELSITEFALRAAGFVDALVDALEKAQQYSKERDAENQDLMLTVGRLRVEREDLEAIRAAAEKLVRCKGRYHSELNYRALAALFGVNTPDLPPLEHENVHYADAAEIEIAALRQRIAELEESNAQVIHSRDHYKRMTEEGLKRLAESRTVKLPVGYTASSGHPFNEAERTVMIPGGGDWLNRFDVEHVLTAAGIKWEAE